MDDARLAALLEDAVSEVEPSHRIGEIRARVQPSRRPWWYAGGALVAAAATVAAVALVAGSSDRVADPVDSPTGTPVVAVETVRLYWVGDTPRGPRLFGEPTQVEVRQGQSLLEAAVTAMVEGQPLDPDYRNDWVGYSVEEARESRGQVVVVLQHPDVGTIGGGLGQAQLAAVIGLFAEPERLKIKVVSGEGTADDSATDTSEFPPSLLEVMALVQIEAPLEGVEVSGSFTASGRADSFEATVPWRLEDAAGQVVREGFATAEGWAQRLYPWETEVDVRGLAPGTYTFVASTSDPSGGTEDPGPTTDTRTVVVR